MQYVRYYLSASPNHTQVSIIYNALDTRKRVRRRSTFGMNFSRRFFKLGLESLHTCSSLNSRGRGSIRPFFGLFLFLPVLWGPSRVMYGILGLLGPQKTCEKKRN